MGNRQGKVAPGFPPYPAERPPVVGSGPLASAAAGASRRVRRPKRYFWKKQNEPEQTWYREESFGGRSMPDRREGVQPKGLTPFRLRKDEEERSGGVSKESPEPTLAEVVRVSQSREGRPVSAAAPNGQRKQYTYSCPVDMRLAKLQEPIIPFPTGKLSDHYSPLEELLGKGNFGVVSVWVDRNTGDRVACKSIFKRHLEHSEDIEDVRREILILQNLRGHAKIVGLRGIFEDEAAVHLVMELCEGGPLSATILQRRRFTEQEAAALFRQVAEAVCHVHDSGIMHRDLKPENILLERPTGASASGCPAVKLADFGLAVYLRPWQKTNGVAGSPYYFAPEVVTGQEYGREADIWSLGVILYVLLSGMLPFYSENEADIFEKIRAGKVVFSPKHWKGVSEEAKSTVCRLLMLEPRWRPSAQEVLELPFVKCSQ